MTVSHTKLLELLGKDISFSVILKDEIKQYFPDGIFESGTVEAVLIQLSGNHEILVGDVFYSLDEIEMKQHVLEQWLSAPFGVHFLFLISF